MRRISQQGFTLVELLVVIGVLAILASILLSALAGAQARARETDCRTKLQQIALAIRMYADDHGGVLPPPERWEIGVFGYLSVSPPYHCPALEDWNPRVQRPWSYLLPGYAYNALLNDASLSDPPGASPRPTTLFQVRSAAQVVCLLEARVGTLTLGAPDMRVGAPTHGAVRHRGGANYAFVDGHVRWYRPEAFGPRASGQEAGSRPTFFHE